MGQLKQQFEEPDWYQPPHQQQQQQQQRQEHVENRDQHWTGYDRGGGNSLVGEERDTRMPSMNGMRGGGGGGGGGGGPQAAGQLSPRSRQFMASREAQSYMMAIKAVDDSLYSDGSGSITVLRGLWKVFDSVVSELGTELTTSIANKAVFEGEILYGVHVRGASLFLRGHECRAS